MVIPLRICLVVLFAVLVVFQTLSFPGQFAARAAESPQFAPLRWPATALAAFWLLCAEVVIVATWALLSRVRADRIFTTSSLVWVDVIVGAIAAAWVVLVGVVAWVGSVADEERGPVMLLLLVPTLVVAVVGLLMVVMRALLRAATTLRTDMDAVI
ncbi:membrane protein [Actinomycetospora sp. NBRC 106375]|nr:membrane protein [Actinomycetospora sp. NBRC 106375]